LLVVTFTNAATAELGARIRQRIAQLERLLDDRIEARATAVDEPFCVAFAAGLDDAAALRARSALRIALARVDEMAVHTIHGFCQRVVDEHALSIGVPSGLPVSADSAAPELDRLADWWRAQAREASPARLLAFGLAGLTPDALHAAVKALAANPLARVEPAAGDWRAVEGELTALRDELAAALGREGDALLDWIGPGQPTTEESLPEPELLPELFETLGVDPPEEELTSLSGHPLESQVWDLAEAIGLIEADTSQVRPGEFAEDWRPEANGLTAALDIRRRAVAASVTFLLTDPRIPSDEPDEVVARIVYQGLMPVNIPLEAIDEIEEEDELLGALVKARLTAILVDGWLVIDDDKYVVPEALRPAVWAGFPDYLNPELGNDQAMITVRADMPGITPPVWRTLRLHSWVRLDELHDVLQIVFDWEDAHLHQFIVRHTGHVHRYMPEHAIRQGLHPAADTEVEERIRIGELLAAPGDELIYEYDFGDDWTVRLVVEQIEQIEPENDDPSATVLDGSGTAPFEDVGGAGGWDEFLEAINDPEHPRYQELREWTGMPERIQLDPTLFDVADVNRLLLDPDM